MDGTALWVLLQRRKHAALHLLALIVVFAAGWQLGRVMSPYYAAHPIVFEETAPSGGSVAELTQLKLAGTDDTATAQAALPTPVVEPEPTATTTPAVAGTATTDQKLFVGSVNSDKYHHKDCSTWQRIKPENQIWFSSVEEAEAAGYEPTACTQDILKGN